MASPAGPSSGMTAVASDILAAASQTPGLINVVAYSGGAESFIVALQQNPGLLSRIGNIVYLSPGAVGTLPVSQNGTTTIIFGNNITDYFATLGTTVPPLGNGVSEINTGCGHSDFNCLEQTAMNYNLIQPMENDPRNYSQDFYLGKRNQGLQGGIQGPLITEGPPNYHDLLTQTPSEE